MIDADKYLSQSVERVEAFANDSFVERPGVKTTGYNCSTTGPLRLVMFFVSDKEIPFLNMTDMPVPKK